MLSVSNMAQSQVDANEDTLRKQLDDIVHDISILTQLPELTSELQCLDQNVTIDNAVKVKRPRKQKLEPRIEPIQDEPLSLVMPKVKRQRNNTDTSKTTKKPRPVKDNKTLATLTIVGDRSYALKQANVNAAFLLKSVILPIFEAVVLNTNNE